MAIYHLHVKMINRSGNRSAVAAAAYRSGAGGGRSAVAAAAYRAGGRLHDRRHGLEHDYGRKGGVVHAEIRLPEGAPEWMGDRERLWNAVEAVERRKDAQLAREVEISLPRELGRADQIELLQGFVDREFVARGMVADIAVHDVRARDGGAQPHAHVMLSTRELLGDGFGKKAREWNQRDLLAGWREAWACDANAALERRGSKERIDHRSLVDQRSEALDRADQAREAGRPDIALVYDREAIALDREPQPKVGPVATALEKRGQQTERGVLWHETLERNRLRLDRGMRQLQAQTRAFLEGSSRRLQGLWGRAEIAFGMLKERWSGSLEQSVTEPSDDGRRQRVLRMESGRAEKEREPQIGVEQGRLSDTDLEARRAAVLGRGRDPSERRRKNRDRDRDRDRGR